MIQKIYHYCPGTKAFQEDFVERMCEAPGSSGNHQAWKGGYYEHIAQCMLLAMDMYYAASETASLPFSMESAMLVLYFHDIEKLFRNEVFDKEEFLNRALDLRYGIKFTPEEQNALKYIHGEGEDYQKDKRIMGPLAAFCHAVDTMSARIFYDTRIYT